MLYANQALRRSFVLAGIAVPMLAGAVTIKDFTLVNTSATPADDLEVTFNQPVSTIRSNRIFDNKTPPGDTGNKFDKSGYLNPGGYRVAYTMPSNGQTVVTGGSVKITLETQAAQLKGLAGFQVDPNPNLTYFTKGGKPVPPAAKSKSSVRLVSANVDIIQDPNTALVSASVSNPTNDFLFITGLAIYTGLSAAQADTFDANGNFITSGLPSSPNFNLGDMDLTPGQPAGSPVSLGDLPSGSWVVALYNLADGPDSNINDATNFGQFFISTEIVPEPSPLMLLIAGLLVCLGIRAKSLRRFPREAKLRFSRVSVPQRPALPPSAR